MRLPATPLIVKSPSHSYSPINVLIKVVFPPPFSPTIAKDCPASRERLMSRSVAFDCLGYAIDTPLHLMDMPPLGSRTSS